MPNFDPLWLNPTNITITRLIKDIVAVVNNTVKGIININYKIIIKVFIKVYFKVITKRSTTFIIS